MMSFIFLYFLILRLMFNAFIIKNKEKWSNVQCFYKYWEIIKNKQTKTILIVTKNLCNSYVCKHLCNAKLNIKN